MTFPGAGAQIYHNEAGEPLGWDYPGPDDFEDFDEADYADEGEGEGEDEDEWEWEDEGDEPDIHDPAHERDGIPDA